MQEKKESHDTLLGPFAILSTSGDIQWIQFTIDQAGKVAQFKTANTAQFVQNDWQINTEIPSKLSVYSPGLEKSEFCFVFTPKEVFRFYFSSKGNPWPGEPFINGLFRHASIRDQDVTSNDWWHPNESLLVQINQQYHERQQRIRQGQSLTEAWHEDREIKPFDFIHDDQGNKKNIPKTVLSLKEASEIQQCIFEDWSDLKAASKHSKEYCQALKLLLSPTLLPEDLTALSTVLAEKVVSLQKWFLPTVINKFSKRLNPSEKSTIFIADIQSYLHNLVINEITQYFPEQVLPSFVPEEKFRTTKIGAMTDQMGQLLFQFTEAMSGESQQLLLQLRQLMSGNADNLTLMGAENLLRIVAEIEQRQTNAQTQTIESDLVAINTASRNSAFDTALRQLKKHLEEHIIAFTSRPWMEAFAREHCPQLDSSQFEGKSDSALLVEIYQSLISENTPQPEQDALLTEIMKHTRYRYLKPWIDDKFVKIILARAQSLTSDTLNNILDYCLAEREHDTRIFRYGAYMQSLIKDLSLEKTKIIIDKVRSMDPDFLDTMSRLELYHISGDLTQAQMNLLLDAWDIYNRPFDSIKDILIGMKIYPESKKEALYTQYEESINRDSHNNASSFLEFMAVIPEQYKENFYTRHKHLIENISDSDSNSIRKAFTILPEPYRTRYVQTLIPKITMLLSTTSDPSMSQDILRYIRPELRDIVFPRIKPFLIADFKRDLQDRFFHLDILEKLTKQQCIELLKPLEKVVFAEFAPYSLGRCLSDLSKEKCTIVCETFRQSILKIFRASWDIESLFMAALYRCEPSGIDVFSLDLSPAIYDVFKEKIVSTLKTEREYNALKTYLTPEDLLDLNHRITVYKLQAWVSHSRCEAFQAALLTNHESTLKNAFDALLKPKYTVKSLFSGNVQANINLIEIIASAETTWLHKLNVALTLELTDEQLMDKALVKAALEHYVATDANITQAQQPPTRKYK